MSGNVFVLPVSGTGVSVGTGITTYSGLVTSVTNWLNRDDLGTLVPDFITLSEERLNRLLRTREMEEVADITTDAEAVDLPTDFRQARELHLTTDPLNPLEQMSLAELRTRWAASATGKPQNFAIVGQSIYLGPVPDSEYTLRLHYYQDIPHLSTENETNWVIVKHPSLYLFGALLMAELYGWNDERLPMIKSAWDEAIGELQGQGYRQYAAGPVRIRSAYSV